MKNSLVSLLFLGLIACNSFSPSNGKTVFRYNEAAGISSLDPAFARNVENMWAVSQIYEGLVQLNEALDVVPSLAKSWEIDSSGTEYTFYLKNQVYFHTDSCFGKQGTRAFKAQDVVYSIGRILNPAIASPGRWVFDRLDTTKGINGVEAMNDTTVVLFLKEAYSPFLSMLTMPYASIVPIEAVQHYGNDFSRHPVGTGPYRFFLWKDQVKLVLHQSETYGHDTMNLKAPDALAVSFIKDKSAAFLGLLKNDFDMISGIDGGWKAEMLSGEGELLPGYQDKFYLQKVPYLKTDYLGFQLDMSVMPASPWNMPKVRRALDFAINKEAIVVYLRSGVGIPANSGFVPPILMTDSLLPQFTFQPDSAKSLLTQAGYPSGEGLPELVISTTAAYADICELIQHQLTAVGIRVKVDVLPSSNHRQLVASGQLSMFRKSWIADFPNAANFLELFHHKNWSPNGPNYTRYTNPVVDSLLNRAYQVSDLTQQKRLLAQVNSIVSSDAPVIPLFYDEVVRVVSKRVSSLPVNGMNMLMLKHTEMELQ